MLLAACYQPEVSADRLASRDAGSALRDAAPSDGGGQDGGVDAAASAGPKGLAFRVRTAPVGGRYAPRNIGAIWIEDGSGTFIKTLSLWASPRKRYLRRFMTASNGDVTDAITSATLLEHVTHEVHWDLRDRSGRTVPPGAYRVVVETTDRDASGDSLVVPFTRSETPVRAMPADTPHFLDMSLILE